MEKKIKAVFDGFPGVDYVWYDDNEVYFNERANCTRITRKEFFESKKSKSKNIENE